MVMLREALGRSRAADRRGAALAALLPWVMLGALPAWVCAAFAVALAVSAWSRAVRTRSNEWALPLLVAGLLAFTRAPDVLGVATTALVYGVVAVLLGVASEALREGAPSGGWVLAALFLWAPSAPGLAAFLLVLALRDGPEGRATRAWPGWRAWGMVAVGAAALALATAFLPRADGWGARLADAASPLARTAPPNRPPGAVLGGGLGARQGARGTPAAPAPRARAEPDAAVQTAVTLLALGMALVLLALRWRTRGRAEGEGGRHWSDYALAAGAALMAASLLVYAFGSRATPPSTSTLAPSQTPPRVNAPARPAPAPAPRPPVARAPSVPTWPFVGLSVLAFGVLVAVATLVLRTRAASPEGAAPEGAAGEGDAAEHRLHRVRAAYRRAEAALTRAGWSRAPHETPGAYLRRVAEVHPDLADALRTLGAAYDPVRYGGMVTEADADAAEGAARATELKMNTAEDA
ncbi:DUF4129 domain-containing protein [Deinococcus maricopensis]|uniref:Protein-glutamine gamma-glutamyltransferase-like C-terminal domain-containing protein n=1 Tax=Deinococcus maricopensis (strain DSM 21211 / LMG 22137 / NRRL B-23946 / LB-34) TaxID=709986 RepID=E8UA76_DEIML|nr:DUF4129 domain-containing protein [Deinococcus maricopensis]ADV67965.1 hypothetical protein Deima_2327 [Deinococcus maricopensis DSM 21211]